METGLYHRRHTIISMKPKGGVKKNVVYPENRRCSQEGCMTTLSRYNPHKECWVHRPERYPAPRVMNKKKRPFTIVVDCS